MTQPVVSWTQAVTMWSLVLALCPANVTAEVAVYCSDQDPGYGAFADCPEARPVLERDNGRSLYWQDICGGGYRHDEPLFHDSMRPLWYASGESLAFFRDRAASKNVRPEVPGGTLDGGSGDFDTEFDNGARVLLGRSLGDWYRLDVSWLGGYEWSDTVAANLEDEFQSLSFRSRMNSAEVNLRRRVRTLDLPKHYPKYFSSWEFSTILGFRYFDLEEQLDYVAQSAVATNAATVTTDNQMAGVQIGALSQWLYEDRGWLDCELKGAILSNKIGVASNYTPDPGSADGFTGAETQTSFLVDASLIFNYQFARAWTFRIGYNMIWVNGAALAADNISSDATLPLINVEHSGETIFHGPSIGLVLAPSPHRSRSDYGPRRCRP